MVILIPDYNLVFFLPQVFGSPNLINNGIGKGNSAARVLNEIILRKMRLWKFSCFFIEKGMPGKVHKWPEKSVGEFTIVTMHMLGVEKNEPHVKIIFPIFETHAGIRLYLYLRKVIGRVAGFSHLLE
jgi:hypothetical protein